MVVPNKTPSVLQSTSNHSKERCVGSMSCKNSTNKPNKINPKTIRVRFNLNAVAVLFSKAHDHKNEDVV